LLGALVPMWVFPLLLQNTILPGRIAGIPSYPAAL
jgi:hypothetical protein